MGIAALVLGIVSALIAFIPFCGVIALIPALVGLILGIIDLVKKNKSGDKKGMTIAGTILSGIAVIVALVWFALSFIVGIRNSYYFNSNRYDYPPYNYNITDEYKNEIENKAENIIDKQQNRLQDIEDRLDNILEGNA
ncbi:MAG: DUF4190 domain-containing protein [Clostridia bacterium]